jgi:DNA-binding CsgD family transcriptional regulator
MSDRPAGGGEFPSIAGVGAMAAPLPMRPPAEPGGRGKGGDLAAQLVRVLVNDMQSVVGVGSDDGVLLLDRQGVVHGKNRAAREMAEARFFMEGESGALLMSDRGQHKAFRTAFEQFWMQWPEELRVLMDKQTLLILRPAFDGATVVALVAVTIRHVQRRIDVPLEKLQSVLGVSPKQAELAKGIMRGLSPVEFAEETGCSVKTARFHLYALMHKVGCHSQIELGNYLIRTFG